LPSHSCAYRHESWRFPANQEDARRISQADAVGKGTLQRLTAPLEPIWARTNSTSVGPLAGTKAMKKNRCLQSASRSRVNPFRGYSRSDRVLFDRLARHQNRFAVFALATPLIICIVHVHAFINERGPCEFHRIYPVFLTRAVRLQPQDRQGGLAL
jgi:hypothetical protein